MIGNVASGAALYPNRDAIIRYLAWLCAPALGQHVLRLEIAWGNPTYGPRHAKTFFVSRLAEAADFACWINRKGNNVYGGSTLKHPDTPEKGRTTADHALMATCLPIDIDSGFVAAAEQFALVAQPQLLVITGTKPATRGQLFARIDAITDLASWEQLHALIVRHCGGDQNALGRNRLMRLGGTVSYPSEAKIARGYVTEQTRIYFLNGPQHTVSALYASLPVPSPPAAALAKQSMMTAHVTRQRATKPPVSAVEAALRTLPDRYADERSLWIKVGFALYDFDPGQIGLRLWQFFSRRCPDKANATDFQKLWSSFVQPTAKRCITIAWLLSEARKQGRKVRGLSA